MTETSNASTSGRGPSPRGAEGRPVVVALEAARAHDASLLGGKGYGLAKLVALGVEVPRAFVVTTVAFDAYRAAGSWPDSLKSSIEAALRAVGDGPLAVRSSATDEDSSGASFAGQHETFLNVRGSAEALEAIRKCWASLQRPEALRYRAERGLAGEARMAVVVQRMVPATASGVAFTAHPVHGDSNVVVIDLCEGLGDALVSGTKTPDHYVLQKEDRSIVQRELSGAQAVLADERVREVGELALRIERGLGAPQDIEWALADGVLWALQARPITSGAAEEAPSRGELDTDTGPSTTWTCTNVQEVLPGMLSPLTQSIVLGDFDAYSREALRRLGIRPRTKEPMVGCFQGRAFLNLSLAQEIGGQTASADEHYMGTSENELKAKPASSGGALAKLRLALALPKTLFCLMRLDAAVDRADRLAAEPLEEASPEAHASRIKEHGAVHVLASIYSGAMFTILGKLTERWLGDKDGELHGRLLRGLAGMDSARPAYELWELALLARAARPLRDAVEKGDSAALAAMGSEPSIASFRARLEQFLGEHGHHSTQEMELRAHAWDEDVATVLAMVRNYLDAEDSRSPAAVEERARQDREGASQAANQKLRAWQRPVFRYFLRAAQRWVPRREHTKHLLIRAMHRRRQYFRARALDLVARGLLADAWDMYYLTSAEVARLERGELDTAAARQAIQRRRLEERRSRLLALPDTFTGRPVPRPAEQAGLSEEGTLKGIPVSRGSVTGPARVILDPRADSVICPGEILVAPVTDAAWTPLFTVAAGLVVDIGGALSHGSTVAREYGLPAVVNTRVGTRVIRTGDIVTVDGTRGLVRVHRAGS